MSAGGSFIGGLVRGWAIQEERERKGRAAAPPVAPAPAPALALDPNGVSFDFVKQVQPRDVEPSNPIAPDVGGIAGAGGSDVGGAAE